jgi:hypothetical protein
VIARWRCPEDQAVIEGVDAAAAEEAVRQHFKLVPHEHYTLAGFTDRGPAIAGTGSEPIRP